MGILVSPPHVKKNCISNYNILNKMYTVNQIEMKQTPRYIRKPTTTIRVVIKKDFQIRDLYKNMNFDRTS